MAGWKQSSVWLKVSSLVLCVAFLLFLIGFSTESWATKLFVSESSKNPKSKITFGLFIWKIERYKTLNLYLGHNRPDFKITESVWYRATQILECLGLICMAVALLILFLFFCVTNCKRRNALLATIILTFASVVFIIIGVAVFATKMDDRGYDVGWSMGLAIAGAILAFIAGIMELIELK